MPLSGPYEAHPVDPFTVPSAKTAKRSSSHDRRFSSPGTAHDALERAFAACGLVAVSGTAAGALLGSHGYGWPAVLGVISLALLLCAVVGIVVQDQVVRFQRGEVALVYATALQGPRRAMYDRRQSEPTRMENLGLSLADLVDSLRLSVLSRDYTTRCAIDMRRILGDRATVTESLAATLGEDAHAIAAAANATRRAEAEITADIGFMWQRANQAAEATANMTEEAQSLAAATKALTAQIGQAATLAANLADAAFAAQRGVVAVGDVTTTLTQAAEQVKAVLNRAEMLGISAGIEAARAGDEGRGFAVVASEMKILATGGHTALEAMLQIVRGLKTESAGMRQTLDTMAETVRGQSVLGHTIAEAASYQIQSVSRVVAHVLAANADIVALRDRAHELESRDLSMGTGPAARKAVERLPAHAEVVAQILRDLPQLATLAKSG
jgi:hypothetical protein